MQNFFQVSHRIEVVETVKAALDGGADQRPQKSELSGWQNSTRKNIPDGMHKSFLRQTKCINRFGDKKHIKLQFDLQVKGVCAAFVTSSPFYVDIIILA